MQEETDNEDDCRADDGDVGNNLADVVDFLSQAGLLRLDLGNLLGNLSDLGLLTGGDDDSDSAPAGNGGGGVGHVDPVSEGNVGIGQGLVRFDDRVGFPGQG